MVETELDLSFLIICLVIFCVFFFLFYDSLLFLLLSQLLIVSQAILEQLFSRLLLKRTILQGPNATPIFSRSFFFLPFKAELKKNRKKMNEKNRIRMENKNSKHQKSIRFLIHSDIFTSERSEMGRDGRRFLHSISSITFYELERLCHILCEKTFVSLLCPWKACQTIENVSSSFRFYSSKLNRIKRTKPGIA